MRRAALILLAASALASAPAARASERDPAPTRLLWGGGLAILPNQLGTEEERPLFGLGLGHRIQPRWMLEARGTAITKVKAIAPASVRRVAHVDLNLSWVPRERHAASPFLTFGAGAAEIAPQRAGSKTKFAWNGGGGLELRITRGLSLRAEGRVVGFQVPVPAGGEKTAVTSEIFAGLSFGLGQKPPDRDHDGVPDRLDRCPETPPGVRIDALGCAIDTDGDGVPDGPDRCDGTLTGCTVDARGCPVDSDGDGVCDGIDMCPDTPAGAKVDPGGCPIDSDGDGVPDGQDRCADTPRSCTVDTLGCPVDGDHDAVCDGLDRCPDTPAGTQVDVNGCPATRLERETQLLETGLLRLEDINFDTGKAVLRAESFRPLNDVGDILARWPELRIEIGGHTDAQGSAAANGALSKARAQAVLTYLLRKFPELDPDRFAVVGYGESKPIASDDTELGRARNRRVEFKVLNSEVLRRTRERSIDVPKE
jgi:outer membrane protein OmpA-like peptidoglycan-associated protein